MHGHLYSRTVLAEMQTVRATAQKSVRWVDQVGKAQHDSREQPWFLTCVDADFQPTTPSKPS